MNKRVKLVQIVFLMAAFGLILVSTNSFAIAQDDGERGGGGGESRNNVVPGGPGFVSIAGGTFKPVNNIVEFGQVCWELNNPSSTFGGDYVAPVIIPHGATVTKFVIYYYDKCAGNLSVKLIRKSFGSEIAVYLASGSSDGTPKYGNVVVDTIYYDEIDLQSYVYFVHAFIPAGCAANLSLVGVRIDYAFPTYVPLVNN